MTVTFILESQKMTYTDHQGTILLSSRASLRKQFASVKLPLMDGVRCKEAIDWCVNNIQGRCLQPNLIWPKEKDERQYANVELFFERKSDAMLFKLKWC